MFDTAADIGFNLKLLDIGGGYPGESDSKVMFMKVSSIWITNMCIIFSLGESVTYKKLPYKVYI